MKLSAGLRLCSSFVLLLPYAAMAAQDLSIGELLKGEKLPTTMKIADLPPDYKAVRLLPSGSSQGSYYGMDFSLLMTVGMMGNHGGDSTMSAMQLFGVSWTNGQEVKLNGQEFLVTYKLELAADPAAQFPGTSPEAPLPGKASLNLTLVKTDSIVSIEPMATVTKDTLIAALDKGHISFGGQASTPPGPADTQALKTVALSNLKQIATSQLIYLSDYNDVFPYAQSTKAVQYVTVPYSKSTSIWKTLNLNGGQVLFNISLGGASSAEIPSPAETPMFYEEKPWPDGTRGVGFADGHAKFVPAAEWQSMQPLLHLRLKRVAKPLPLNYGMDRRPGG